MSFIRKVRIKGHTYLREVKSVREGRKIRQKYIRHLKLKSFIKNPHALALVYSQLLDEKSINKLEQWFTHTEIPE